MGISATNSSINSSYDTVLDHIDDVFQKQTQKTTTKNGQDPLSQPAANTTKTAQSTTDIVVSNGKNVGQLVMEHSGPNKLNENENRTTSEKRDLGVSSTKSNIGTQADENALSAEINAKPNS